MALRLSPLEFMQRLAALVPRPAEHGVVRLAIGTGGPSFLGLSNNSNAGNNTINGVFCSLGGSLFGSLGTLSGDSGAKNILTCLDLSF